MLCDALAQEGYAVLVARDATEALQRFELAVPEAVLLDEHGFALCRRLKAEPSWAHVPVIFMTGLSETAVLSWLAKGKTSRDIADILGMSPRTVNKHLEHIFEKLGVETRTAASAIASSLLQDG